MKCWIHKWEILHRKSFDSGCWFEDRKCKKCGERKMVEHMSFFSSIGDAINFGVAIGIYNAMTKDDKFKNMVRAELDKIEQRTKGLGVDNG